MQREATPLAIAVAAAVFAATFFTTTVVDVPLLWFDPVQSSWTFGHRPSTAAIDWYGRTLMSALAWVVAWTSTHAVVRKPPSRETVRIAVAWAVVAFAFAAGLYAFALWNRRPTPEPLPSWYEAR
jgi:hypothetical protein